LESEAFNESEMALFSECRPLCAQTVLDTADIVRDGDITTAIASLLTEPLQIRIFSISGKMPIRTSPS